MVASTWTRGLAVAALALSVGACARPLAPVANQISAEAAEALASDQALSTPLSDRVNPDKAQEKAIERARAWRSDARLVAVNWAVAKWELTSMVFHLFHSPKGKDLLVVVSKQAIMLKQTQHELNDSRLEVAARALAPVGEVAVSARQALEIARAHEGGKPFALLTLFKPARLMPPMWVGSANELKLLIHADTGKVIIKGDVNVPWVPFMGGNPAAKQPGLMVGPVPDAAVRAGEVLSAGGGSEE